MSEFSRIRVVILINNMQSTGGAERLIANLAQEIDRSRFDLHVVSMIGQGAFTEQLQNSETKIYSLNLNSLNPVYTPLNLLRLYRLLRQINPDIIHTHLWAAGYYGRLVNWWLRRPMIVTEQNMYVNRPKWQIWINRFLVPWTNQIIAISQAVKNYVVVAEGIPSSKIDVIYSGIDTSQFVSDEEKRQHMRGELGLRRNEVALINIASLSEQKGHKYLLSAVAKLCREYPVRLLLVGDGALRPELEKMATKLDIREYVQFLGVRQDIPDLLNAADIFVFPSIWEGLGLALLEAMSVGLPVVVSDLPPLREIVEHGRNGLLVPAQSEHKIAVAIERYLENPLFSQRMAEAARLTVKQKFSIQACARAYEALYERMVR